MNGEALNAATLRNLRDAHAVTMLTVPSRADLEGYRHAYCAHDGIEDARHERLIPQQRGAAQLPADLLCGAAHVQVDDLCTVLDIQTCGLSERLGVGACKLHHARLGLTFMAHAVARFGCVPEPGVRCQHLGSGQPCAELAAQNAERAIGHSRHRREHNG